ncbi:MAG TPA: hypothetical protein PLL20_17110 [Phycisphaerae bacterium]|nr:hypothetical protein [Phycisphaerae bacterium]
MLNSITSITWRLALLMFAGAMLAGCNGGPSRIPTEPQRRAMLSLMLPTHIKIQPFTRIASFDKDNIPDGVIVVLRAIDRFGDPVKAAGPFYFELWSYQPASGEPKGQRLAFWDQTLDTADKVSGHWTHAQMYEFKLGWPEGATSVRPGSKYVLTATYRTPWDETMTDEYVLDFSVPPGAIQRAIERKPPQTAPGM